MPTKVTVKLTSRHFTLIPSQWLQIRFTSTNPLLLRSGHKSPWPRIYWRCKKLLSDSKSQDLSATWGKQTYWSEQLDKEVVQLVSAARFSPRSLFLSRFHRGDGAWVTLPTTAAGDLGKMPPPGLKQNNVKTILKYIKNIYDTKKELRFLLLTKNLSVVSFLFNF